MWLLRKINSIFKTEYLNISFSIVEFMTLAKDIMTDNVETSRKKEGLHAVVKKMVKSKISCVVIKDGSIVKGIITERDLIRKILLLKLDITKVKIEDVMTKNVISAMPDDSLEGISKMMKVKKIRHLPVIRNDDLLGIITQSDIANQTQIIELKNKSFMNYQDIQTKVIIVFFIFLILYLINKFLMS